MLEEAEALRDELLNAVKLGSGDPEAETLESADSEALRGASLGMGEAVTDAVTQCEGDTKSDTLEEGEPATLPVGGIAVSEALRGGSLGMGEAVPDAVTQCEGDTKSDTLEEREPKTLAVGFKVVLGEKDTLSDTLEVEEPEMQLVADKVVLGSAVSEALRGASVGMGEAVPDAVTQCDGDTRSDTLEEGEPDALPVCSTPDGEAAMLGDSDTDSVTLEDGDPETDALTVTVSVSVAA